MIMTTPLCIFINYCSAERAFIHPLIQQCAEITAPENIYVSIGSHFYRTYEHEDTDHITDLATSHPRVNFVIYEVTPNAEASNPLKHRPTAYWHNVARIAAWRRLCELHNELLTAMGAWILFLDADEIPEGAAFRDWFHAQRLFPDVVYRFANYWYFREPTFRATTPEYSPVMLHSSQITPTLLMDDMERTGYTHGLPHAVVTAPIMFHHFSWVRTKYDMIRKVTSWGHCADRTDWVDKVTQEFERQFDPEYDTDFVHNYSYTRVPNLFNIELHKDNQT